MSDEPKKRGCLCPLLALIAGIAIGTVVTWPRTEVKKEIPLVQGETWPQSLGPAAEVGDLALLLRHWEKLDPAQMEDFFRNVESNGTFWHGAWKRYQADAFLHAALLDGWYQAAPEKAVAYGGEFIAGTVNHGEAITIGAELWMGLRFPDKGAAIRGDGRLAGLVESSPMVALQQGGDLPESYGPMLMRSFFQSGPFSEPEKALTLIDALPKERSKILAAELFYWWAKNDPETAWETFEGRHALTVPAALAEIARFSPVKATKFAGRMTDDEAGKNVIAAVATLEAHGHFREAQDFVESLTITQVSQARAFWESGNYDRVSAAFVKPFTANSVEEPLSPSLLKAILLPKLGAASLTPLTHLAQSGETLDANEARVAVLSLARKGLGNLWDSIAQLPDSPLKTTLATEAAGQSAKAVPKNAIDHIRNLSSSTLQKTALPVFVAEAPESLRGEIKNNVWPGIVDQDLRNRIAYAISRWQPSAPLQAQWLVDNAPDVLTWPDLQHQLGSHWLASNPDEFVKWVEGIKDVRIRDGFLGFVISDIASTETERAEQLASDLLLRGVGLNDLALSALGKAKLKSDTVGALAWTERIEEDEAREKALQGLVPLLKELSSSARNRAIDNAPLSEGSRSLLKAALK